MGKHRRPDADTEAAADRTERLVRLPVPTGPWPAELCVIGGLDGGV